MRTLCFLAFFVCTALYGQEEKVLGDVMAVKRTIELRADDCLEKLEYAPKSYRCVVDFFPAPPLPEQLVKVRSIGANHWSESLLLEPKGTSHLGATFSGYYTPTGYVVSIAGGDSRRGSKESIARRVIKKYLNDRLYPKVEVLVFKAQTN